VAATQHTYCAGSWVPWIVIAYGCAALAMIPLRSRVVAAWMRWNPRASRALGESTSAATRFVVIIAAVVGGTFLLMGVALVVRGDCS
jgi:hypothetical protein